jgi:palmitoyltransferase
MRLNLAFHYAVPFLGVRSMREAFAEEAAPDVTNIPESSALIAEHYNTLVEDLTLLNNLLVIGRNMLAVKEVAQDICATVHLDTQVIKLIVLCVNVTSKGYDGENVDSNTRLKLNEVTELCKYHFVH